ncbi:MAG: leucine-rich repeat domain-containing protein [Clostridia bacterium]|nr:leucine-rich repeat domain-containing protein [Clostridia bacterium]
MKHTKQLFSIFLALVMLLSTVPFAFGADIVGSGTCGENLTWTLDSEGTLTISGTDAMTNYPGGGSLFYSYWSQIKSVTINTGVMSIGDAAFEGCSNLTDITIPNSVTSIGECAFKGCSNLTDVTIPNSLTSIGECAFKGCSNLTDVTIPNSVASIGDWAFYDCNNLTNVTISGSVTSIGGYAFECCHSLTDITVASDNANYASDDNGCLFNEDFTTLIQYPIGNSRTTFTIPNSVTCIDSGAFRDCSNLTSVTIPDNVTSIEPDLFYGCSSLTDITIPNSVTVIGTCAFSGCSSLTGITIPDSVTRIGIGAFLDCSNLTDITIGNSVSNIGWEAFNRCNSLTDVYYTGSENQWNQISILYSNDPLFNATIHFNTSQLSTDQTDPTVPSADPQPEEPTTQPDNSDSALRLNFFQRIIQWLLDLFARLFSR